MTSLSILASTVDFTAPGFSLGSIDVAFIDIPAQHRLPDPNFVAALVEDMARHGQIEPIHVVSVGERFRLRDGRARIVAIQQRGLLQVDAVITSSKAFAGQAEERLSEISARFVRRDLTVLDKAQLVAEWRDLYEATVGVVKVGRRAISVTSDTNSDTALATLAEQFSGTFTDASKRALNLSQKGVYRALKIASIEAGVRRSIELHPLAQNQTELLALAEAPEVQQIAASQMVLAGNAISFSAALAVLSGATPEPLLAPWESFAQRFTRLPGPDQERFFELNASAIERWWVRRSNR